MGRHIRLGARIAIVVAACAIAVAVGVALLLSNTIKLRHSADATIRFNAYLVSVIDVERLVLDAETGLRGYVITRRPLFLQPLRAAQARLPQATAVLRQAAAHDHSFLPEAQALDRASNAYLSSYVPRVLSMAVRDAPRARSFATTLAGKRQVDHIRALTASLESMVTTRQDARQRAARDSATGAVTEAIVVLVLLTILTVLLGLVLGRLAAARELARKRSESTTRILQQSLLPRETPVIPGCELAVRFAPAGTGDLVGGDFYDVFAVTPDRWAVVLGDVCGKDAEAASVTAMARWTLRSLVGHCVPPVEALRFLNQAMLRQDLGSRFITIVYLLVAPEPDQLRVSVACAGHPPPVFVPETGEPSAVRAQGNLLGVWPDISLQACEVHLAHGDSLVAYTDGVTDQGPQSQPLSPSGILRHRPPGTSAERLATLLEDSTHRLPGPQRDDIAILVLRFTGPDDGVAATETDQRAGEAVASGS